MIEITLNGCQAQVGTGQGGLKVLQLIDPQSHITVTIPLTLDAARSIGVALSSGLIVAGGPLKTNGDLKQ